MKKLFRIYNTNYNDHFKKMFKFFEQNNENYEEEEVIPDYLLEEFTNHKKEILDNINLIDSLEYVKRLENYDSLFSNIERSKINSLAYKAIQTLEINKSILSNLKSFKPNQGYADRCEFDNSQNISGRLIVNNGPNILTLPKRCRNIFESRFKEGSLLSLDFVNLEPRFCLKIVGNDIDGDIYNKINELLEFNIDRSIIKRAIISVLYGASHENLKNISASKSLKIFETIKEFFNMEYLLEISSKVDDHGIRRNFFGRPIWNLEEKKENIIINNFVQSSAVDISLTYFSELVNQLDLKRAVPIFIIHDAIVFDIQKDYINEFSEIIKKGYNDKDLGNFPVSISQFNNSCD